jgi:hypothetical protein
VFLEPTPLLALVTGEGDSRFDLQDGGTLTGEDKAIAEFA